MKRLLGLFREGGLRGELLRGSAVGFSVKIFAVLAGLLSSVVIARVLGPTEYGVYAFALAVISILALPVQLGLPTLVVRETARAAATEDWALMRGIWGWATTAILVSSSLMICAAAIWFWLGAEMNPSRQKTLMWGLPLIPLLAFAEVRGAALRGLKHIFMGGFPDQVLRPILLTVLVSCAAAIGAVQASSAIAFYVAASSVAFALGAFALWQARPEGLKQSHQSRHEGRAWRRSILPLSMIAGLQIVNQNTDLVMLGIWRTDIEVGIYRIAVTAVSVTFVGVTVFNSVMQPHIATLFAQGKLEKLQNIVARGSIATFLSSMTLTAVFAIWGHDLLGLVYGEVYRDAYGPMLILSIGTNVLSLLGLAGVVLTMSGHEGKIVRILLISAAANVVLNVFLIPGYGTFGAATATAISVILTNFQLWLLSCRVTGINCLPLAVWAPREGI